MDGADLLLVLPAAGSSSSTARHRRGLQHLLRPWTRAADDSLPLFHTTHSSSSSRRQHPRRGTMAAGPPPAAALTPRALLAGLGVGMVLCCSNMYFGLQTGWVTMGSLQSAILGYGLFQGLGAARLLSRRLSVAENVIVQTTAVATATMPLAAGLVGIIPALGMLSPEDNPPAGAITFTPLQLLGWCSALAFFGVFVAVPLRYQTIIRERLVFPSGTATASVIRTLHGLPAGGQAGAAGGGAAGGGSGSCSSSRPAGAHATLPPSAADLDVSLGPDVEQAALLPAKPALSSPAAASGLHSGSSSSSSGSGADAGLQQQWAHALRLLLWVFAAAGAYSLAAAWVKPLRVLPFFDWIGLPGATAWGFYLQPSAGYIGQGMIMGPKTAVSMFGGAIAGWALLGPLARARGWAPGPIQDFETGAAGWLMWLGLALLLGDCFSELGLLLGTAAVDKARARGWLGAASSSSRAAAAYARLLEAPAAAAAAAGLGSGGARDVELSSSPPGSADGLDSGDGAGAAGTAQRQAAYAAAAGGAGAGPLRTDAAEDEDDAGGRADADSWMLSARFWVPGLLASTGLCTAILSPLLGMPVHEPLIAVLLALLVALLAVRALGQTDLNPVSGVGKISQLVFALVSPGAVVPNLVAGAIAEAGAQQAGDLMQDFKTAALLGVAPSSQLVAMLLGSAVSVPLSVAAYLLYTTAWQVPGPVLPAPTALIWVNMARLVNGGKLPDHVGPFCLAAAAIAALLPVAHALLTRLQQQQQPARAAGQLDAWAPGAQRKSSNEFGGGDAAGGGGRQPRPAALALRQAWLRLHERWRARSAVDWALALLPSGVGFAVGMYLSPHWTLPRLLGSLAEQAWLLVSPASHAAFMMVTASGLVLGEGCASVVTAVVQAALA